MTSPQKQPFDLGEEIHSFFYKKAKGPIWATSNTINAFQDSKESAFFECEGDRSVVCKPLSNDTRVRTDQDTALPRLRGPAHTTAGYVHGPDTHGASVKRRTSRSALDSATRAHREAVQLRQSSTSVSPRGRARRQPAIHAQPTSPHQMVTEEGGLPPIPFVRERTLYLENFDEDRKRDCVPWGSQNNLNAVDGHWRMKPRPVRPDVEDKIVHHLKRQFVRRLEQRYHSLVKEDTASQHDLHDAFRRQHFDPADPRHPSHQPGRWRNQQSPVTSGDARGVVRSMSRPATREDSKKINPVDKLPLSLSRPRVSNVGLQSLSYASDYEVREEDLLSKGSGSRARTPSQHADDANQLDAFLGRKVFDLTGIATREQTTFDTETDSDEESLDPAVLERILKGDDDEQQSNFPDLPVSPVPTPFIFSRPQTTRSMRSVSMAERRRLTVEGGVVHLHVTPATRALALYLHSAGRDTEVERTALMQHTWPALRTYCRTRGYDLEVVDLEWGCGDLVLDDHSQQALATAMIDQCHRRGMAFTFMTMLAQKQGCARVPARVERAELDTMLQQMHEEKLRLLAEARRVAEQLQAKQAEEAAAAEAEADKEEADGEVVKKRKLAARSSKLTKTSSKPLLASPAKTPSLALTGRSSSSHRDQPLTPHTPLNSWRKGATEVGREVLAIKAMKKQYRVPTDELYPEPELVASWFTLDTNHSPPVYRLKPVSSHFPDITGREAQKRKEARMQWQTTRSRLLTQMHFYGRLAGLPKSDLDKYVLTSVEQEVRHAILDQPDDVRGQCLWVRREIQDISLSDTKSRDYVNIDTKSGALDVEATERLDKLKVELQSALSESSMQAVAVNWSAQGIAPATSRYYSSYTEGLCRGVYARLQASLHTAMAQAHTDVTSDLQREVLEHVTCCQQRAHSFYGRAETLQGVKQYVRSGALHPLVLQGEPGSGKTALLARAALDAHAWLPDLEAVVVVRMIGVTSASVNIRLLLRHLALQLCAIYERTQHDVPQDFKSLSNSLYDYLALATADRPLLLFFDSLQSLSDEHAARQLVWLPALLPPHVKVVVSTDPDSRYDCLPRLQALLQGNAFLQLLPLSDKDATVMLGQWFRGTARTLAVQQKQFLLDQFKKCPQPLYLWVLFNESLKWTSDRIVKDIKLGSNCRTIAQNVFARLERDHGEPLVRRALGYLTAGRNGISSSEMEDLLSLDEVALSEITLMCHPPLRRIPPLLWVRLKQDLNPFVEETQSDHTITLKWMHTPFNEAASDRYLKSRDLAPSYHKPLAEYFQNTWYRSKKPYSGSDEGELRYVMEQGIHVTPQNINERSASGVEASYNYRALSEMPYHFLKAAQADKLKTHCLCNFHFVSAKMSACSVRALFEDLQMALAADPNDKDVRLLLDTLQLSLHALADHTDQMASQLIGRMLDTVKKDKPVAPHDPVNYPFMKPFMAQTTRLDYPVLAPTKSFLTAPGGQLFDSLAGHSEPISALTLSPEGNTLVTTSNDNTLKVWSLKNGSVSQTVHGVGSNVYQTRIGARNKVIITSETNCLRFWSMKNGVHLKTVKTNDPCSITVTCDTMCLVAIGHGSNVMTTFDLASFKELVQVNVREQKDSMIHRDESIVVAQTFPGLSSSVLYAFRSQGEAMVRSSKSGEVTHRLKCTEGASIQALAMCQAYFICAARFKENKAEELFYLEYFTVAGGKFQKSSRGCTQDVNIREVMVNNAGSHALALCPSPDKNSCNIAVWNIATDDHKHIVQHAHVSRLGACVDLQHCLTAGTHETTLRVWDVSSLVGKQAPKAKPPSGIDSFIPVPGDPNTVVSMFSKTGSLSLWDVAHEKEIAVHRGLAEKSDIVLFLDMRAVILTDKAYVGEEHQPVYQSIHIYDLASNKYVHQLKDCFIFPSPAHEYVLLDDDHLLGLSEIRSHFVIWNLTTGQIVHRLKTNFREKYRHGQEEQEVLVRRERQATARMLPWKRRTETHTARQRRRQGELDEDKGHMEQFRREKENHIDMYRISDDRRIIVASFYARHLCVFDIEQKKHVHTFENFDSLLLLHVSVLSPDGSHLVLSHYDDDAKISFVTMWNCTSGDIQKRIKNEKDVCCITMNDTCTRIVFGKKNGELRIWEPYNRTDPLRKVAARSKLELDIESRIQLADADTKAVVLARSVSLWDLERACVLAVFTPDTPVACVHVAYGGHVLLLGLRDSTAPVTLRPRAVSMTTPLPPCLGDNEHSELEEDEGATSSEDEEQ